MIKLPQYSLGACLHVFLTGTRTAVFDFRIIKSLHFEKNC